MRRGGFSFTSALKRRNEAYKKYLKAQALADKEREKVIKWEDLVCSLQNVIFNKWKRHFPRSCNFSGWED